MRRAEKERKWVRSRGSSRQQGLKQSCLNWPPWLFFAAVRLSIPVERIKCVSSRGADQKLGVRFMGLTQPWSAPFPKSPQLSASCVFPSLPHHLARLLPQLRSGPCACQRKRSRWFSLPSKDLPHLYYSGRDRSFIPSLLFAPWYQQSSGHSPRPWDTKYR